MTALRLSLRMLRRDWLSGELRLLALALVVAVASVSSVHFFTSRVDLALRVQANELLGADLELVSSNPIPEHYRHEAETAGLKTAQTIDLTSMTLSNDKSQLVSLKAVSEHYPLRGQMRIADKLFAPDAVTATIPAPGTVWAESRLLTLLGIDVGAVLTVGQSQLQVAAVLASEPAQADRGLFNTAPRLLLNLADLPATELVQPASRLRARLLVAGGENAVSRQRQSWQSQLDPGMSLRDVSDARPEVRTALERAERFLGLAALVAVLLAAAAVAMAARRFAERRLDDCAVMRCLGATQGLIGQLYLGQMLLLGLIASLSGCLLGYLGQWALVEILGPLTEIQLPAPALMPWLMGVATGIVILLGFAIPPLLQLRDVPTLRVLRREIGGPGSSSLFVYGTALLVFALLVRVYAGDTNLAMLTSGGLLAVIVVLSLLAYILIRLLRLLHFRGGVVWRFGVMNISRRAGHSVIQMLGFGIGMMALLLLGIVRSDLMTEWQGRLPVDAPNRFLINIQPDQLQTVEEFFRTEGLAPPQLHPMVRGRLLAINDKPVSENNFDDERGKRLATREFNLSWAAQLQTDNEIIAGHWWRAGSGRAEMSVEEGIAKTLKIKLGDVLSYNIAGETLSAEVTSLRKVQWDSFKANFFVLMPPGLLEHYPASYMAGFYLAETDFNILQRLVERFPNITVLDVAAIMAQVRRIIDRVSLAVEAVFGFTLLAGLMVMVAAIQATLDERIREAAILRTLGAARSQLQWAVISEYAGLGALSGLVAAIAAGAVGSVLAERVFELQYTPSAALWLVGIFVGGVGVAAAGTLGTRFILNQPPLQTLRGL